MSRRNRERRRANAERRGRMGLERAGLPRRERRQLERELSDAPLIEDVRAELAHYSSIQLMEVLTDEPNKLPPFAIARFVREVALKNRSTGRPVNRKQVDRLIQELANVLDPELLRRIGLDFTEVMAARLMAGQVLTQRDFYLEFYRTLAVLSDNSSESPLGSQFWHKTLGQDLGSFLLGVWALAEATEHGPIDLDATLAQERFGPGMNDYVRFAAELLTGDFQALHDEAMQTMGRHDESTQLHALGPLTELPLYRREDGRIAAPSVEYVRLAASTPSLYIRLLRVDRDRLLSQHVGERLKQYLLRYLSAYATKGWEIRDLDAEPAAEQKRADVAFWPADGSFLVVVEVKSTLHKLESQLGDDEARQETADFYQSAFDQIHATTMDVGRDGFLPEAPSGVPVMGLVVTLERHQTTLVDGATIVGVALDELALPQGTPRAVPETPSCVISADDLELVADLFAWCEPADVNEALDVLLASADTRVWRGRLADGLMAGMPDDVSVNPAIVDGFYRLADSVDDPRLAEHLRRLARKV